MTFAIICHRDGAKLTQLLGPVPLEEARTAFKKAVTDDSVDAGDGQFHGTLELFELREPRAYKIRHALEDSKVPRKRRARKQADDSQPDASPPETDSSPDSDPAADPSASADVPTAGG